MDEDTRNTQSPDNPAAPAAPVEDQTPPPGFEPQTELGPDQEPGVHVRDGVTTDDVDAEVEDADPADGEAEDNDDSAEDGDTD